MKIKVAKHIILFSVIFLLIVWLAVIAFAQENALQGMWIAEEGHVRLKLDNGSFEEWRGNRLRQKGLYSVSDNRITMTAMYVHSSFWGIRYGNRLFSQAEAQKEFGSRGENWFEPAIHTFSVNSNELHLIGAWGEWRLGRGEGFVTSALTQNENIEGAWFDDSRFVKLMFNNGIYNVEIRGEPNSKGVYTIIENEITRKRTHIHSTSIGAESYRWYSEEDAVAEFGSNIDNWFEPFTQTFFISGDILTFIDRFGEQQFSRMP